MGGWVGAAGKLYRIVSEKFLPGLETVFAGPGERFARNK
jgi:hypothetical protein